MQGSRERGKLKIYLASVGAFSSLGLLIFIRTVLSTNPYLHYRFPSEVILNPVLIVELFSYYLLSPLSCLA
jgi:hypothetical protein